MILSIHVWIGWKKKFKLTCVFLLNVDRVSPTVIEVPANHNHPSI